MAAKENSILIIRIVLILALLVFGGYLVRKARKENNPRTKAGYDVIEHADSLYYIRFIIDSVKAAPKEPNEQYR